MSDNKGAYWRTNMNIILSGPVIH